MGGKKETDVLTACCQSQQNTCIYLHSSLIKQKRHNYLPPDIYTCTHTTVRTHTEPREETTANRDHAFGEDVKRRGGMVPEVAGWRKLKPSVWRGPADEKQADLLPRIQEKLRNFRL